MSRRNPSLLIAGLLVFLVAFTGAPPPAAADHHEKPEAQKTEAQKMLSPDEALALLSRLEGSWEGLQIGDTKVAVTYETVSRGTAVIEVIGRGTAKEMATVYSVEGNELIANHYCLAGHRTQMRLNREKSTPDRLYFDYVNLSNVDLRTAPKTVYVQGLAIQIPGEGAAARARGFAYAQDHAQGLEDLGLYSTELRPAGRQPQQ